MEPKYSPEQPSYEMERTPEKGANVEILLKFIRHGERGKDLLLTDFGRQETQIAAVESGINPEDYDAVKAIGSNAGPVSEFGMGRALETADIYAHTIAEDEAFRTKTENMLSYKSMVTPVPYDHVGIYNANLPENFESLSDEEKKHAAQQAQNAVMDHLASLDTPEAKTYIKENAGAFAVIIDHYQKVAHRLKSGSRVLMPAGTHGGTMEFLLQLALVHTNDQGERVIGFSRSRDIGGGFNPSEAYNVDISTDEQGHDEPLRITFDSPNRPDLGEMYLDPATLEELKAFYLELHAEEKNDESR